MEKNRAILPHGVYSGDLARFPPSTSSSESPADKMYAVKEVGPCGFRKSTETRGIEAPSPTHKGTSCREQHMEKGWIDENKRETQLHS